MTGASPDRNRDGRIEIDAARMIDGLVELLDELADLAINRVVLHTGALPGGFDPGAVGQAAIDRFKVHWFAALGELMFHGMAGQANIADVRARFEHELDEMAAERRIGGLAKPARAKVRGAIAADAEFNADGVFAAPKELGGARYRGLGADLAAWLVSVSFSDIPRIAPIMERVAATAEAEFVNAYAECARACSRFEIV